MEAHRQAIAAAPPSPGAEFVDAEEGDDEQFAQTDAEVGVADEELDEMAEFLAQLDQEQIEKLNTLVETKRESLGYNEDF